jgi:radical SAM protein with 4Fe4S-binding SPASM domain
MRTPYLHLGGRIIHSNLKRLPFPYKLTFAVTYRCNSRCTTCNIWKKKGGNELSGEEIERFFKNSPDFSWIDLTGGEPSLRNDFADICTSVSHYCDNLVLLHFPTNGYLTEKIVSDSKKMSTSGSSSKVIITVSTDGDEALNDSIRGVKGAWKRQIETFKQLHELKTVDAVIGMTLSRFNFDKFETTYKSIKAVLPWLTPRDFHISLMNYSEMFYDNWEERDADTDPLRREQLVEGMVQSARSYKRMIGVPKTPQSLLEYLFLKRAEHYLRTGKTPLPCHALKSSCFVDPTGEVYPCITFNYSLGNLREYNYDLRTIWNLETTKHLQQKIWRRECPQCWTGCDGYQTIMGNLTHLFTYR